jgi:putative DNA primase/helicase
LLVQLLPIAPSARGDEETFWTRFDACEGALLGLILNGVAAALANIGTVHLNAPPRIADFARWATAAEPGLGLQSGAVLAAYRHLRARAVNVALEASPVGAAMRLLVSHIEFTGTWEGTPKALLDRLSFLVGDETRRSRQWPHLPSHLTRDLRRAKPCLAEVGIEISASSRGRDANKQRWITVRVPERYCTTSSRSSPAPSDEPLQAPRGDDGDDAVQVRSDEATFADYLEEVGIDSVRSRYEQ